MYSTSLIDQILPSAAHGVRPKLQRFLQAPEFAGFARSNAALIRKKLKNARELEDQLDVVAELEFACLLAPHTCHLEYEPQRAGSERSPDFRLVTITSQQGAYVEVKRVRQPAAVKSLAPDEVVEIPYTQRESFKFSDVILHSLTQLTDDAPNLLFIRIDSDTHETRDVAEALLHIRSRFRKKDSRFFHDHEYNSLETFLDHYRRLSAVVARSNWLPVAGLRPSAFRNSVWQLTDARCPICPELLDILREVDLPRSAPTKQSRDQRLR